MKEEDKRPGRKIFYAHTSSHGNELLGDHLEQAGELAGIFGGEIESSKVAALMGRVHDIGKLTLKFSRVLERTESKVNHAIVAAQYLHNSEFLCAEKNKYIDETFMHLLICAVVKGHHSRMGESLARKYDLKEIYQLPEDDEFDMPDEEGKVCALSSEEEYEEIVQYAEENKLTQKIEKTDYLPVDQMDEFAKMLYARMLFSCLVDADYTATAMFCDEVEMEQPNVLDIDKCMKDLTDYRSKILKNADPQLPINVLRNKVYHDAEAAGDLPAGFYSMTAPTGTAKTLALIRFALGQVKRNGYKRIFVVLPYLSIISQNANIYKETFGDDVVFEDDSNTQYDDKTRTMVERWNAPIIVTTSVKFFETLFTDRAAPCRKLHHVANSVVVFDECQVLPHELTSCTIMTLKALVDHFHVSVLLSTATFPGYQYRKEIPKTFHFTEIIRGVKDLYREYDKVKRTKVIAEKEPLEFWQLCDYAQDKKQMLFVFNTVGKTLTMYEELKKEKDNDRVFYLSSDLCAEHKKAVIETVKEMLKNKEECYLVSTQCIEAGVDIDFPAGAREYAPLPSVIQTAGRVNRNGKVDGEFLVFMLKDTDRYGFPSESYYTESQRTLELAKRYDGLNLNNIDLMDEYYMELYGGDTRESVDKKEIKDACEKLHMGKMCDAYKLIDVAGQCTVIVPYSKKKKEFDGLMTEIKAQDYCITKKQMKRCADFRVNRYMNGKKEEFVRIHCHQLYARVGRDHEKTPINWFIADVDDIYDERTGLQRVETDDAYGIWD